MAYSYLQFRGYKLSIEVYGSPVPNLNNINKQMKRILSYLLSLESKLEKHVEEYDGEHLRPFITKNIANGLGVKPRSIISNLKIMEEEGLIRSRRGSINRGQPFKGKTGVKMWWLTDEGEDIRYPI